MIGSLRTEQHGDLESLADGLTALVRGDDTLEAAAAALNVAELLRLWRARLIKGW